MVNKPTIRIWYADHPNLVRHHPFSLDEVFWKYIVSGKGVPGRGMMPLLKGVARLLATLSFSFLFPFLDRKLLDSENRFFSHDPVVSEL